MKRLKYREMVVSIGMSYTALSLVSAVLSLIFQEGLMQAHNAITMLLWTTIGVVVLYSHIYMERFSPAFLVMTQYAIALALVVGSIWVFGLFLGLHPDAYRDGIISFSIPYWIGTILYYIEIQVSARRQNRLLQAFKQRSSE